MPRTISIEGLLERLVDGLAARVAARASSLIGSVGRARGRRAAAKASRRGARAGRKLDMSCRVEGCKNKSRGPRFGFICDEHRKKLTKKEQQAAREAWKAKASAA